jgi:hypothetical protein
VNITSRSRLQPHTLTFSSTDQLYLGNQWTATSDDAMSALKITVRLPLQPAHIIISNQMCSSSSVFCFRPLSIARAKWKTFLKGKGRTVLREYRIAVLKLTIRRVSVMVNCVIASTCNVLFRSQQSQALVPHFNIAIEFIHSAIKKGGRVLVHCAMGQSRSLPVLQCVFVFPSSDLRYCGGFPQPCACCP